MAKVTKGVETLPKISTGWVGCMSVTDDRQTGRRTGDSSRSRSLKSDEMNTWTAVLVVSTDTYRTTWRRWYRKQYADRHEELTCADIVRWRSLVTPSIPGAQKHLFHISSTKGLRPRIYASMIGDPKEVIRKFSNSAQQPGGASKYPLNLTLNSQFEYIFQTRLKMFCIGVEVRIPNS